MSIRTPGTALRWANLGQWLTAQATIETRPASAGRHAALAAHLAALPDELVERASTHELDRLEELLRHNRPPRGQRAGHPGTRLLDAIDRTRAAGRQRGANGDDLVTRILRELRAAPPTGCTAADVEGFGRRYEVCLSSFARISDVHP